MAGDPAVEVPGVAKLVSGEGEGGSGAVVDPVVEVSSGRRSWAMSSTSLNFLDCFPDVKHWIIRDLLLWVICIMLRAVSCDS